MRALRHLYVQVLLGVFLGIVVGLLFPYAGEAMKPLGDGFVKLIKLVIAPVVFVTVAGGIAHMGDVGRFGRVGGKALLYFEVVSTFALVLGLVVGNLVGPGRGFNIDPDTLSTEKVATYIAKGKAQSFVDHILGIIPDTFVGAFATGDLLQVLLLAVLTGFALTRMGELGTRVAHGFEAAGQVFFGILSLIVKFAPIGAFGAMAFTIGKYGPEALGKLAALIGTFYLTAFLFIAIVLGLIARWVGFSLWSYIRYMREELFVVLGTSSSESALPQTMAKLERLGASRSVVGLVVPTGYSFNLDGTNIYMTLATLFLAQATNTHLSFGQQITLLLVAMLTSKGASGVTGAGFITLAATLQAVPTIPIASLALLVGIDRFMSECRALTNVIGNGVAALVVAKWEGALDRETLQRELSTQGAVPG